MTPNKAHRQMPGTQALPSHLSGSQAPLGGRLSRSSASQRVVSTEGVNDLPEFASFTHAAEAELRGFAVPSRAWDRERLPRC